MKRSQTIRSDAPPAGGRRPRGARGWLWASLMLAAMAAHAGPEVRLLRKPDRAAIAAAQAQVGGRAPTADTQATWRGELASDVITRMMRRELSIPWGVTPLTDSTGIHCSIHQDGDVWFIGGSLEPVYSRACTVPFGKAVVVPVAYYVNDFPCPDPSFVPAPGQSLEAFLRAGAAEVLAGITLTEVRLGGRLLTVRRVVTPVFGFTGAIDVAANYDQCITGAPQLAVADGHFAFVDPLPRGTHVLHVRSVGAFGESLGTVTIKVR